MENDEFILKKRSLVEDFEQVFKRLLAREPLDLYEEDVSFLLEVVATNLLAEVPERQFHWYDGVVGLTATIRKARQVEFAGEMWVGNDAGHQWREDFRARVTDKQATKQGIWIVIWLGEDRAEGNLPTAFGVTEQIEPQNQAN